VLLNTDFLDWLPQEDTSFDAKLVKENRYAVNVVHINPDQWQEACGMFPRAQFDGHYNIGVWLWELETLPDLTGMRYDEARDALSYYGLYLTTHSGLVDPERQTVSSQSLPAGTPLRHGTVVEVTLIDSDEAMLGKY
jgi:hypothetical protein